MRGLDEQAMEMARAEAEEEKLRRFVQESNRIEDIHRPPTPEEIRAHKQLFALPALTVATLEDFVKVAQPDAVLRRHVGQNAIRIVDQRNGQTLFEPPASGPRIVTRLESLLDSICGGRMSPAEGHAAYETLHPFSDGNGRSGRAIWAWQMLMVGENPYGLPFLHRWYYQSLDLVRRSRGDA